MDNNKRRIEVKINGINEIESTNKFEAYYYRNNEKDKLGINNNNVEELIEDTDEKLLRSSLRFLDTWNEKNEIRM